MTRIKSVILTFLALIFSNLLLRQPNIPLTKEESPPFMRAWKFDQNTNSLQAVDTSEHLQTTFPNYYGDIDQDNQIEHLIIEQSQAILYNNEGNQIEWKSPESWQITQANLTDLNHDGQLEIALLLWREFQPWPIDQYLVRGKGRIQDFHDSNNQSCHLILIRWKEGQYRQLWAGSALADPLYAFAVADLDNDNKQEFIALEGSYDDPPGSQARALTIWKWNGFGFSLQSRLSGFFNNLKIQTSLDNIPFIITL